jgi:hypothetical protein
MSAELVSASIDAAKAYSSNYGFGFVLSNLP